MSVRIAKGVSYRVGQVRAHSVVVGTHLEAQDSGHLVVTDRRAVFMGAKKTLEFRRDRLVGLGQYADGLRLSVSNRQTASLFRFAQGSSPTIVIAPAKPSARRLATACAPDCPAPMMTMRSDMMLSPWAPEHGRDPH